MLCSFYRSAHPSPKQTLTLFPRASLLRCVGEFEVFEEAVEFPAVQRAPRTMQVIPSLRLLPRVVVVQKLWGEKV